MSVLAKLTMGMDPVNVKFDFEFGHNLALKFGAVSMQ